MSDTPENGETWRERLVRVDEAVTVAKDERARVFSEAMGAGVSARDIASVVGVSHTTVWRITTGTRMSLDTPAPAEKEPS